MSIPVYASAFLPPPWFGPYLPGGVAHVGVTR